jgi:hypothetical protein
VRMRIEDWEDLEVVDLVVFDDMCGIKYSVE